MRVKGFLTNTILQGKVERRGSQGRPSRQCLNDGKEWTGMSLGGSERTVLPEDSLSIDDFRGACAVKGNGAVAGHVKR